MEAAKLPTGSNGRGRTQGKRYAVACACMCLRVCAKCMFTRMLHVSAM